MLSRLWIASRFFLDEIETIVFDSVQQWCHQDFRVPQAKPFDLTQDEIYLIADFERGGKSGTMLLGRLRLPTGPIDQAANELFFAGDKIYHPTLCMSDQRDATNSANSDGIRDFEFTVSQIGTAGTDDKCKVIRNVKVLSVVHTHSDQQLRVGIGAKFPFEMFEEKPNGCLPILRRNIFIG